MHYKKILYGGGLIWALGATSAMAQITEISSFQSIHGTVIHKEDARGRSLLSFQSKSSQIPMPPDWKNANVDQVIDLVGETAVLMSHADPKCESRMRLLVITKNKLLGPYDMGDCEDLMVYQKSEDGKSLIGIRADQASGSAWVYSSEDDSFRGPVKVRLPDSMANLVSRPDAAPAPAKTDEPRITDKNVPSVASNMPLGEKKSVAATPSPPTSPVRSTPVVPVAPATPVVPSAPAAAVSARASAQTYVPPKGAPVQVASASTATKNSGPVTGSGSLSKSDASKVADEAKKIAAPQRPRIIIDL